MLRAYIYARDFTDARCAVIPVSSRLTSSSLARIPAQIHLHKSVCQFAVSARYNFPGGAHRNPWIPRNRTNAERHFNMSFMQMSSLSAPSAFCYRCMVPFARGFHEISETLIVCRDCSFIIIQRASVNETESTSQIKLFKTFERIRCDTINSTETCP